MVYVTLELTLFCHFENQLNCDCCKSSTASKSSTPTRTPSISRCSNSGASVNGNLYALGGAITFDTTGWLIKTKESRKKGIFCFNQPTTHPPLY